MAKEMQDVAMQHLEGNKQRAVCPGAFPAGAAGDEHTALLAALRVGICSEFHFYFQSWLQSCPSCSDASK